MVAFIVVLAFFGKKTTYRDNRDDETEKIVIDISNAHSTAIAFNKNSAYSIPCSQ